MEGKASLEGVKGAANFVTTPTPIYKDNQPEDVAEPVGDDKPREGRGDEPCVYNERGVCHLHGQAQKRLNPGKVWARLRSGLFGWKYKRTTYYVCGTVTHPDPGVPEPTTFVSMRKSSKQQNNFIASSKRGSSSRRFGD